MSSTVVKLLILIASMLCHALAWLLYRVPSNPDPIFARFWADFVVLLGLSAVFSAGSFLVSWRGIAGLFFTLRAIILLAVSVPLGAAMGVKTVLLLDLLLGSAFRLRRPHDVIFPLAVLAVFVLFQRSLPVWHFQTSAPPVGMDAAVVIASVIVAATALVLKKLAAATDRSRAENDVLAAANVRLGDTNIEFQDAFIREKDARVVEERARIAREVHDTIAYVLTNLIMMIEDATDLQQAGDARLAEHLRAIRDHAQKGLTDMRQAIRQLREGPPRRLADIEELYALAAAFQTASHIKVEVNVANASILGLRLAPPVSNTLFRLVQECMTNALRHGKADRVSLFLDRQGDRLRVSISDNGSGSQIIREGFGLRGMKERMAEVNGRIEIKGSPVGFALTAWLPATERNNDETDTGSAC